MLEPVFLYKDSLLFEKYCTLDNVSNNLVLKNTDNNFFIWSSNILKVNHFFFKFNNFFFKIKRTFEKIEDSDDEYLVYGFSKQFFNRKLKNHYKKKQRKYFLFYYYLSYTFENFYFNFNDSFCEEEFFVLFSTKTETSLDHCITDWLNYSTFIWTLYNHYFSIFIYDEMIADIPSIKTFDNKFIRRQYFSTILIEKSYVPSRIVKGISIKTKKVLVNIYEYYYDCSFFNNYLYDFLRITKKFFYLQNTVDKIKLRNFLNYLYKFEDTKILLLINKIDNLVKTIEEYTVLKDLKKKSLKNNNIDKYSINVIKKELKELDIDLLNFNNDLKVMDKLKKSYIEKELKLKKEIKKNDMKNYRKFLRLKQKTRKKSKRYLDSYEENCHHTFNNEYQLFLDETIFDFNQIFYFKSLDIFNKTVNTYSSDEELI